MKRGNVFWAGTFVLGLSALVGLGPEAGYGGQAQAADEPPCDDRFCLERSGDGAVWSLKYGFKGLHDQWHEVTCTIDKTKSKTLSDSYGYRDSERAKLWPEYLEKTMTVAARVALALEYGEARIITGQVEWVAGEELPPLAGDKILAAERRKFEDWYPGHKEELGDLARHKFLEDRGFTTVPRLDEIPDYSSLVREAASVLKGCVEALNRETGGQPELLQAFFQSMFFEKIPLRDGEKRTGGLSPPTTVMIRGKGDCDSKAAAYCTIQRKNSPRLVILRSFPGDGSPSHALVGVEAWKKDSPNPKETWPSKPVPEALQAMLYDKPIRVGLREYWPCEVAGRRRTPFREVEGGHEGKYIAIRIQ